VRVPLARNDLPQNGASRRTFLRAFTAIPLAAAATPPSSAVGRSKPNFGGPREQTFRFQRTREKRSLSCIRYQRAESFFASLEHGFASRRGDELYQVGIVIQLALSAHLLDVGFDDAWCVRNIGLYLNRSLEHANATGLYHECPELKRLAEFLSPYGRWRNPGPLPTADASPFSHELICHLTRELLERVRNVTGHPRPRGRGPRNG